MQKNLGNVLYHVIFNFYKYNNIYRRIKNKKGSGISEEREEKRALGLIILRGDAVVSMTIEGPPPPEDGLGLFIIFTTINRIIMANNVFMTNFIAKIYKFSSSSSSSSSYYYYYYYYY